MVQTGSMSLFLSHLSHTSFLFHVLFDMVPDAALCEEVSSCSLLKLLIGSIFPQGQIHDSLSLRTVDKQIGLICILHIEGKRQLTDYNHGMGFYNGINHN